MKFKNETLIPGSLIKIFLGKKDYSGTLMESPKEKKGIILLKLNSGYNIGINRKDIIKIEVLKKFERKEIEEIEVRKDNQKPNIAVIITGGAISSRIDAKTGGVNSLNSLGDFFKFYPELFEMVNISRLEIPFIKNSEDINFKDMKKIARLSEKILNDSSIKGIIITHGTDFLHYTSSFLSFALKSLNKPVVLTYSQKSIDRASSDANLNLRCSALAAISDIAEVMVVGHANSNDDFCYALPGTKIRKMHTSRRDAFKVINGKPIAKIDSKNIEIISPHNIRNQNRVKLDSSFEEKVALIKIYPGQSPSIIDYYLKNKYKGLILEMPGLGHLPTKQSGDSWLKKLTEAQKKGIVICATAQTIYGKLNPYVYSTGKEILNTGVIYLDDTPSETALIKLGFVLAKTNKTEEVKKLMLKKFLQKSAKD